MQTMQTGPGSPEGELIKHRQAIARLASGAESRELIELLRGQGEVQQAARAAAGGDTRALSAMLEQLLQTQRGAELARRIGEQARQAGLE